MQILIWGSWNYVYEGDIILPEYVSSLPEEWITRACFLGFSEINLELLQKHVGNHQWLDELNEEKLNALPQCQLFKNSDL